MKEPYSIRVWQERFLSGDFNQSDFKTQCEAGWYDWFCRDEALAGRLKKIGRVVMAVTSPFILDNYYVWFKNNCPLDKPLYDDVRFEPLSGKRNGQYFLVTLDSPRSMKKWSLITERFSLRTPEFECANVREMGAYINALGYELEQGIMTPSAAEKKAVAEYLLGKEDFAWFKDLHKEETHIYSIFLPLEKRRERLLVDQIGEKFIAHFDDAKTPLKKKRGLER